MDPVLPPSPISAAPAPEATPQKSKKGVMLVACLFVGAVVLAALAQAGFLKFSFLKSNLLEANGYQVSVPDPAVVSNFSASPDPADPDPAHPTMFIYSIDLNLNGYQGDTITVSFIDPHGTTFTQDLQIDNSTASPTTGGNTTTGGTTGGTVTTTTGGITTGTNGGTTTGGTTTGTTTGGTPPTPPVTCVPEFVSIGGVPYTPNSAFVSGEKTEVKFRMNCTPTTPPLPSP